MKRSLKRKQQSNGQIRVRCYKRLNNPELCTLHYIGCNTFESEGIKKGDLVVVDPTETFTEDNLTMWKIEGVDSLQLGYAYDNFGDLTLHNKFDWARSVSMERAKFLGVIVGHKRVFETEVAR